VSEGSTKKEQPQPVRIWDVMVKGERERVVVEGRKRISHSEASTFKSGEVAVGEQVDLPKFLFMHNFNSNSRWAPLLFDHVNRVENVD
jgi:hypothetical protein